MCRRCPSPPLPWIPRALASAANDAHVQANAFETFTSTQHKKDAWRRDGNAKDKATLRGGRGSSKYSCKQQQQHRQQSPPPPQRQQQLDTCAADSLAERDISKAASATDDSTAAARSKKVSLETKLFLLKQVALSL